MPDLVPIIAILVSVGIPVSLPIVYMVMAHKRKMAELELEAMPQINPAEFAAMKRELGELKELVHQQVILMDRLGSLPRAVDPEPSLRQRLSD